LALSVASLAGIIGKEVSEIIEIFDYAGIHIVNVDTPLEQRHLQLFLQTICKLDEPSVGSKITKLENDVKVKNRRIFIDTCSLLEDECPKFLDTLIPLLVKHRVALIVPKRVIDELEKHCHSQDKPQLQKSARAMLKRIIGLQRLGIIQVFGDETDNFADNVFISVFSKYRVKYRLMLITQDNNLAEDILRLNHSKSVKGYPIKVQRINKNGQLSSYTITDESG